MAPRLDMPGARDIDAELLLHAPDKRFGIFLGIAEDLCGLLRFILKSRKLDANAFVVWENCGLHIVGMLLQKLLQQPQRRVVGARIDE